MELSLSLLDITRDIRPMVVGFKIRDMSAVKPSLVSLIEGVPSNNAEDVPFLRQKDTITLKVGHGYEITTYGDLTGLSFSHLCQPRSNWRCITTSPPGS